MNIHLILFSEYGQIAIWQDLAPAAFRNLAEKNNINPYLTNTSVKRKLSMCTSNYGL